MSYSRRLVLALFLATGCGSSPPAPTGFLSDYSRLEQASSTSLRWVDEEGVKRYETFWIDAVEVHFHDEKEAKKADMKSFRELTTYTHRAVREALQDGYEVAAGPGPGVARVRIALTDIEKVGPVRKIIPVLMVFGAGAGGAAMEAEIVDSVSGEQFAAIIESQSGSRLPLDGLGRLSDAKAIIDGWAKRFRERLDAINAR
ncbi:MAG: DUF3313 domain-containing protein [bacterium]|nr:DUF3313 domain-containing protein [bacterium]